jgi:hypothetical protein
MKSLFNLNIIIRLGYEDVYVYVSTAEMLPAPDLKLLACIRSVRESE